MLVEVIHDSSCLFATNPATSMTGTGEYSRISVRVGNSKEAQVIFTGDKWDEDDFKRKRGGKEFDEDEDSVERVAQTERMDVEIYKDRIRSDLANVLARVASQASGRQFKVVDCSEIDPKAKTVTFRIEAVSRYPTFRCSCRS